MARRQVLVQCASCQGTFDPANNFQVISHTEEPIGSAVVVVCHCGSGRVTTEPAVLSACRSELHVIRARESRDARKARRSRR